MANKTIRQLSEAPATLTSDSLMVSSEDSVDEAYKVTLGDIAHSSPSVRAIPTAPVASAGTLQSTGLLNVVSLSSTADYDLIEPGDQIYVDDPGGAYYFFAASKEGGANEVRISAEKSIPAPMSFYILRPAFSHVNIGATSWGQSAIIDKYIVAEALRSPGMTSTSGGSIGLDSDGSVYFEGQHSALIYDTRVSAGLAQAETVLIDTSGPIDYSYRKGLFLDANYEYIQARGFVVPKTGVYRVHASIYVEVSVSVPPAPPSMLFQIIGKINSVPRADICLEEEHAFDDYSGYDMSRVFRLITTVELTKDDEIQFYTAHNSTEPVTVNPTLAIATKNTFLELRYLG